MNITEILKEYSWAISIFLGIVAITQTWRIWHNNRKYKKLSFYYRIKEQFKVDTAFSNLTARYENKEYKTVVILECTFGNEGTVLISKEDILNHEVRIKFPDGSRIIDVELVGKTNGSEDIKFKIKDNIVEILFEVLNAKDGIKFNLLLAPQNDIIQPKLITRIKDENYKRQILTRDITESYRRTQHSHWAIIIFATLCLYCMIIYKIFISVRSFFQVVLEQYNLTSSTINIATNFISAFSITIIITITVVLTKLIIQKLPKAPKEPVLTPFDKYIV